MYERSPKKMAWPTRLGEAVVAQRIWQHAAQCMDALPTSATAVRARMAACGPVHGCAGMSGAQSRSRRACAVRSTQFSHTVHAQCMDRQSMKIHVDWAGISPGFREVHDGSTDILVWGLVSERS